MAGRDWNSVPYLPILALSPAEMRGLEELPNRDKNLLLPYVHLRPWVGAYTLDKALDRVKKAYGERPYIADIAPAEPGEETKPREVFAELRALRDPKGGYANWCEFITAQENLIPALQLRDVTQLKAQIECLYALGRGLAVHIRPQMMSVLATLVGAIATETGGGKNVCFVIDLAKQSQSLLLAEAHTVGTINSVRTAAPNGHIAVSASSFPEGFTSIEKQDIFERQHFNGVVSILGPEKLIYSDRGSARAEKQMGGGGTPAPRIDYAGGSRWDFFRAEPVKKEDRPAAYVAQAKLAYKHSCFDKKLQVWGCQMIERASKGDLTAIHSPALSTAARINIHLHQQLFHGDSSGLYETDEDWDD